ncbi:myosin heavy chain, clone 203-like [Prorops nasuta]|uniref:myosin heavy chain, clone 203-like n=1 Tax=Prorops nasuta TaxID=863751 RepID=UPI0034CF22B3
MEKQTNKSGSENMRSLKQVEKVNKAIVNASKSIRKNHRALKMGQQEDRMKVIKSLEPIIQPLQKIVNTTDEDKILMKMEPRKKIRLLKRIHSETSTPIKEGPLKRIHPESSTPIKEVPLKKIREINFNSEEINTNRHTSANNAIELNRNLHDTSPTNDNIINLNESFNNQTIEEETSLPMEYISMDELPVSKQYATIQSAYSRELLLGQHETIDDVFVSRKRPRIDNPIVGTANQNESLNINGGEYDAHKRRIINLGEPLNHTDAVTKSYVDTEVKKKENNEDPTKIDKKKLDDFNKITTNVQLQNDKVKNEIEKLDLKYKAKQFEEDFDRKKSEIEKMESNVKLLSDSVKNEIKKLNLDEKKKKFEEDFDRKKGEIERLEINVKTLGDNIKSEIKKLNLDDRVKKFDEDFNRKKSEIEKLKKNRGKRFEEDFNNRKSEIEKLESNVKSLSESVKSEIKNLNLNDKRKKFEEDFKRKKREIEKLEIGVKSLSDSVKSEIKKLNLDDRIKRFEEDFGKKRSKIEKLENNVKLLSESVKSEIKNLNLDDKRKKFEVNFNPSANLRLVIAWRSLGTGLRRLGRCLANNIGHVQK